MFVSADLGKADDCKQRLYDDSWSKLEVLEQAIQEMREQLDFENGEADAQQRKWMRDFARALRKLADEFTVCPPSVRHVKSDETGQASIALTVCSPSVRHLKSDETGQASVALTRSKVAWDVAHVRTNRTNRTDDGCGSRVAWTGSRVRRGSLGSFVYVVRRTFTSRMFELDTLRFLVSAVVLEVDAIPVLNTRMGRWLQKKGWLEPVAMLLAVLTAVVYLIAWRISAIYPSQGESNLVVPHAYIYAVAGISMCICTFLVVHLQARRLLQRLLHEPDPYFIVFWMCASLAGTLYNWFVLQGIHQVIPLYQAVCVATSHTVMVVLQAYVFATMDALMLSSNARCVGLMCSLSSFLYAYVDNRIGNRSSSWAPEEVCYWLSCTRVGALYLVANFNICVLLSKQCWRYGKGYSFADIRPYYQDEMHEAPIRNAMTLAKNWSSGLFSRQGSRDAERAVNSEEAAPKGSARPPVDT